MKKTLLCVAAATLFGCTAGERSDWVAPPAALGLTKNPPVNLPRIHKAEVSSQPPALRLPPGDFPAALVVENAKPFGGELRSSGEVTVDSQKIEFVGDDKRRISIAYRLPRILGSRAAGKGRGDVQLREIGGGPEGASRTNVVRMGHDIVFGEVWLSDAKPIDVNLGQGLRIRQTPADAKSAQGYHEVVAALFENDKQLATLPVGEVRKIGTSKENMNVVVEISHLRIAAPGSDTKYPATYILRVWLGSP